MNTNEERDPAVISEKLLEVKIGKLGKQYGIVDANKFTPINVIDKREQKFDADGNTVEYATEIGYEFVNDKGETVVVDDVNADLFHRRKQVEILQIVPKQKPVTKTKKLTEAERKRRMKALACLLIDGIMFGAALILVILWVFDATTASKLWDAAYVFCIFIIIAMVFRYRGFIELPPIEAFMNEDDGI